MRLFIVLTSILFTFALFGACNGQESSSEADTASLEENEIVFTVDGDQKSTTNVRLAGSDVFAMTGGSEGMFGVTVDIGYNAKEGTYTNDCEYSANDLEGNSNEWTDDQCSIEITTLTDEEVQGNFHFTGVSDDNSEKSVSGSFRVKKMVIRQN